MFEADWKRDCQKKLFTPEAALSHIRNGHTIVIGSGCAEPLLLTKKLVEMADTYSDVQVVHIMPQGEQPLAKKELRDSFRYYTFYIGRGVDGLRRESTVDYVPINMSELPRAIAKGIVNVDVALIQVSPPSSSGFCSLGISVDILKSAVKNADIVIAQVNSRMPITLGDSLLPLNQIDMLVDCESPLIEISPPKPDTVSLNIGKHIARQIRNGMTLHFDTSVISAATMRYLATKINLGIHTHILTDDILRLINTGAVTNLKKQINRGKTIATMVQGSSSLYEAVNRNPIIELYPIDYVNDPIIIATNNNVVSINSIEEIELSGLARADTLGASNTSDFPSSLDFITGSRRSKNGFTIMALPSTTPDGQNSRIVAESVGRGVFISRTSVDVVVTEYGIVYLHGLSIRERALALISIAHPKFRKSLAVDAKKYHYIEDTKNVPTNPLSVYPTQYEFTHTFAGDLKVFFRAVKPSDVRRFQKMFYSLSKETIRMRYHGAIKNLIYSRAQEIVNVDYSQDMAIVGLIGPRANPRIIAEGRYQYNPSNNMGEFDILVVDEFQGRGIGSFLTNYLKKIAYTRGLSGVYAEVIQGNADTMALLHKVWSKAEKLFDSGICTYLLRFPVESVKRPKNSILIYSGRFGDYSYGKDYPYRPDRARITFKLIRKMDFLDEPWMRVDEPIMITKERMIHSHDPGFLDALEKANQGKWDDEFIKYNLGRDETPVFPGLWDYILLYTSATLTGVDLIVEKNANVVFNLLGGFHHAHRNFAEGFCYVNDVIVAIDTFLSHGYRVAYIDMDAHHANGVQDAYYQDDRVLMVSLHESGQTLYPWSGFESEIGEAGGKGFNINVPLPPNTDDEAFLMVFDNVVTPAVKAFQPNVVITQVGADTHRNDSFSHLSLTNNGMVDVMKKIMVFSPHHLILGGGGYNVEATSRAWCRLWAAVNHIDDMPDYLAMLGGNFLGGGELAQTDIIDMNFRVSGKEKKDIFLELKRIIEYHKKNTIDIIEATCTKK